MYEDVYRDSGTLDDLLEGARYDEAEEALDGVPDADWVRWGAVDVALVMSMLGSWLGCFLGSRVVLP